MSIRESVKRRIPERLKPTLWATLRMFRRIFRLGIYRRTAKPLDINGYDEQYFTRAEAKKYLDNEEIWTDSADMIQYFKPSRVFEFGSGLGHLLKECQNRGINIIGSETSEYAIENRVCEQTILKIGEIPERRLPFGDNSFDLVFSSEVMEHVKEEHTDAVIRELHRVCSHYALFTINIHDHTQPGHINMHSRKWWLKKFRTNGFIHDKKIWKDLVRMSRLPWSIFVFQKVN